MSHSSSRALPAGKHFQHLETTKESCSPVNQTSTSCKSFSHCDNIDGCHSHEHKLKRLKTRKQRSKERINVQGGHVVGAPRSKSHHHHTIKAMTHCNNRCQHRPHCPPKRDAVFAQVFAAAKEPSIMTDCRLIGHRGLFNHEVKSIDIERLLSEQRKKEKVTLKQKTNVTTLHFPSSCLPSPGSSNDVAALSVEGVEDEAVSAVCTETQEVCLENEKMACHSNSQGSDITPGQKVLHQFKPSFESETSSFSFASSPTNALPTNKKKFKPIVPESARKPLLTPSGDKENTGLLKRKSKRPSNSSALEHDSNNQEPQHCVSSPVIVDLSSSPATGATDTFDTQQQGSGLDSMLTSINTMASRLCHSLQLPILKRRNLLAESREILLQALHERHGPQFQENLHSVQQCLSFTTGPSVDKGEDGVTVPSTTIYTDEACTTDTAFRVSSVKESHFDTQRTSLKGRRKTQGSNWRPPPPQPQKSIEQAAECMARPTVEKVGDLFDELLTPCSSSTFCIDFLPSETSSPHPTFGIPTVSNWEMSPPQPWENRLNNVRMRESAKEGCFKNSFLNHVREISSGPQQSVDSRHSSLHYSEGSPSTFRLLQQPQDLFEFDRYSRATSLCPQVRSPQESNQLHSFYHFNHPQTSSFLRSHYSNVMHYPPSHMIDRGPSPILPSLPSPEQGFFPPMRLY